MSFVSIIMSNKFISVVADGRATNLDGDINYENVFKIKEFGTKKFVVCTGSMSLMNEIFDKVVHYDDLEVCATNIYEFINQEEYLNFPSSSSVVIGGINKNDEVELFSINNHKEKKEDRFIKVNNNQDDYCEFLILFPDVSKEFEKSIMPTLLNMLKYRENELKQVNEILTVEDIREIQIELNSYVADNDNTVNKNTLTCLIKKSSSEESLDFEGFLKLLSEKQNI